jgi:predicted lipoprotein with Yx(FWY)xxD motif
MKPIVRSVAIIAAAAILAGCGGGSAGSGSGASKVPVKSASVSVKAVNGVGKVLVDSKGFALYSPDQEKAGTIRCTGGCVAIWMPLTLPKGASGPTAGSDLAADLGTVMRPDGKSQVTFDGKPLYRFVEDGAPGKVTGNGLSDSFGGRSFTWHVASSGATKPQQPSPSGGGGSGYGY